MNPLPAAVPVILPAGGGLGALAAAAAAAAGPPAAAAGAGAAPPAAPLIYIFDEVSDIYLPFNKEVFAELSSHLTQTNRAFVHDTLSLWVDSHPGVTAEKLHYRHFTRYMPLGTVAEATAKVAELAVTNNGRTIVGGAVGGGNLDVPGKDRAAFRLLVPSPEDAPVLVDSLMDFRAACVALTAGPGDASRSTSRSASPLPDMLNAESLSSAIADSLAASSANNQASEASSAVRRAPDLSATAVEDLGLGLYSTDRIPSVPRPLLKDHEPYPRAYSLMAHAIGFNGHSPHGLPKAVSMPFYSILSEQRTKLVADVKLTTVPLLLAAFMQYISALEAVALATRPQPRHQPLYCPVKHANQRLSYGMAFTSVAEVLQRDVLAYSQITPARLLECLASLQDELSDLQANVRCKADGTYDTVLWPSLQMSFKQWLAADKAAVRHAPSGAAASGSAASASSASATGTPGNGKAPKLQHTTTTTPQTGARVSAAPGPIPTEFGGIIYKSRKEAKAAAQAVGQTLPPSGNPPPSKKPRQQQQRQQQQYPQQQYPQQQYPQQPYQQQPYQQQPYQQQYPQPQYQPYPYPQYPQYPQYAPAAAPPPAPVAPPPQPPPPGVAAAGGAAARPMCFDWAKGNCARGPACRFAHQ